MRGREKFNKFKPLIMLLSKYYSMYPLSNRKRKFENLRYKKGILGIGLRYALLKTIAKSCGDNVLINEGCFILNPENMELGNNVSIQPMCYIDAVGGLKIGNDVSIAHGVTIMSSNHNFHELTTPIKEQGISVKKVIIDNNVWIGAKATVLYGKTINSGSIVAAGAVVTKNIEKNTIVGGVPARKIGDIVT